MTSKTDFTNPEYLKTGNDRQQKAYQLFAKTCLMDLLGDYTPILTGTIPLEIDIESSDLDIVCYWIEKMKFVQTVDQFSAMPSYQLSEAIINGRETVLARFRIDEFDIEIFGQNRPVKQQEAYLHMITEFEILKLKGEGFRQKIIELKRAGVKTEPAFGMLLGRKNPYEDLLDFENIDL